MSRTRIVAAAAGAVLAAGGATAVLVGPAFGAASNGTTTSTTTTVVSTSSSAAPTSSTSCKKPYPPSAAQVALVASPPSIRKGQSSTLTATLTYNGCALGKQTVAIYQSPNKQVATGQTDNKGTYSTTVAPNSTTSYYASYAGDGTYLAAESTPATIVTVTK